MLEGLFLGSREGSWDTVWCMTERWNVLELMISILLTLSKVPGSECVLMLRHGGEHRGCICSSVS